MMALPARGTWRRIPFPIRLGVGAAAIILSAGAAGVSYNLTPSLPEGIYLERHGQPIRHGTIVVFCLDSHTAIAARASGYITKGSCPGIAEPLGKAVYGLPGDVVTQDSTHVAINGIAIPRSPTFTVDSHGRPLRHPPFGTRRLGLDEYWLFAAHHPRSWDSRYFGPIHRSQIRGTLQPLLTRR